MGIYGTPTSPSSPSTATPALAASYGLSEQGWPYCSWPSTTLAEDWSEASLHSLTQEALRQRRYNGALMLLDHLIERCPQQASHYNNRGLVHLWCRRPIDALADFDQAIHLDPSLDAAYNNRGSAYAALGVLPQAIADYEQALECNPFNTRARINLGITWRDLGQFDQALVCLDEALLFYQLSEYIYAERGRTYHLRGDWNCALADYRRCLDLLLAQPNLAAALQGRVQGWVDALLSAAQ